MPPIRTVGLVDDQTLFGFGLIALLERDPRLVVVGDAADTDADRRRAAELQPNLIRRYADGTGTISSLSRLRRRGEPRVPELPNPGPMETGPRTCGGGVARPDQPPPEADRLGDTG